MVDHHHHHVVPLARISLTLSRHFSLSFITSGRSSGLHSISSHSCWMYVCAGCPAFAWPYVGVHKSTSLMSSSLLLQQCPACLVRLTWIVFMIGGRWPYSWCLLGCCCLDFFKKYLIYMYEEDLTRHWHNSLSVSQWPERPGFNPMLSHIKDSKMVLDATLLNTQHYKVRIKG